MHKRLPGVILVLSTVAAAAQVRVLEPPLLAGPEMKVAPGRTGAWSLEVFRSGGMLGITTPELLRSEGTQGFASVRERARSRPPLRAARLTELEDTIRAAKPSRWLGSYVQPMSTCCDRTLITVSVEICDAENHWLVYSTGWYIGDPIPKDLRRIYRAAMLEDSVAARDKEQPISDIR